MTITNQNTEITYTGNGATIEWAFTFEVPDADSMHITLIDNTGAVPVETVLSPALYSVEGFGEPSGGTVTYPIDEPPITSDYQIRIRRLMAYTQETDLTNQDNFYPQVLEGALDRIVMQVQQLANALGSSEDYGSLAEYWAGIAQGFAADAAASAAEAEAARDYLRIEGTTFVGDGVTTTFALPFDPVVAQNMFVSLDGVVQVATTDYTVVGTDLVFVEAPPDGVVGYARAFGTRTVLPSTEASNITYSNLASGLAASDVQAAIDELAAGGSFFVADITALKALNTSETTEAYVKEAAREGISLFEATDLSASIVGDAIVSTSVSDVTDTITSAAHGLFSRTPVIVTTATADLTIDTIYFAIKVDDDNFKLATSLVNAQAGTAIDLTVTTAITVKPHFDAYQIRVVPSSGDPIDGSSGGFVAEGALSTGGYFWDDPTPGRFRPFSGVIGLGSAAGLDLNRLHGNGNTGTWIDREFNSNYTYIATSPQLIVGHVKGGTAGTFFTRSSDNPGANGSNYGITAAAQRFTLADKADQMAWAGYDELVVLDGAGASIANEIEVTSLHTGATDPDPYGIATGTLIANLALGSGGGGHIQSGGPVTGTPQHYSNFLHFTKAAAAEDHDARAYAGIVSYYNSLVRSNPADETSDADFARLARGHGIVWFNSGGFETARIRGAGSPLARQGILEFTDTAVRLMTRNDGGAEHAVFNVTLPAPGAGVGINTVGIVPVLEGGGGPIIGTQGADTNISLNLRGKGGGGAVQIQDNAGNTKFRASSTGIGFYGGAAVAKPTGVAVTAAGIHAALVSLGLIAA